MTTKMASSTTQTMSATMEEEIQALMAIWPDVCRDILEDVESLNIPDVNKWLKKVLEYNVPTTKKLLGLLSVYVYKALVPKEQLTKDNLRLVRVIGWCVEMSLTYMLLIDDMLDRSLIRRGRECWYRSHGLMTVNDSFLIQSCIYHLIKKHFKGKECYMNLVEMFQYNTFKTAMGQCLDTYTSNINKKPNGLPNLDLYTMTQCDNIIQLKAEPFTFAVPVQAAMHFAGIKDPDMFKQSTDILLDMAHLYQVQDDFLGTFGNSDTMRKDCTDVEEGKCTWLIATALQCVTPEQRKILDECYGVPDLEKVKRVKQLFIDLDIPSVFFKYEEDSYNKLKKRIQQMSYEPLQNLFLQLLKKIYRRQDCYI
ncbi:farnesyl pyrophosphate synthase-like [Monomorium pharaonis]|uniref:farnesyl pyrophosphate synthase-like n=1 Tax=Monomorium pharaonis TaxID=307658 RepID=UPI001746D7A1|nr:farnesyl pyrophosphate synthase-like [Monomorium pharaonis]